VKNVIITSSLLRHTKLRGLYCKTNCLTGWALLLVLRVHRFENATFGLKQTARRGRWSPGGLRTAYWQGYLGCIIQLHCNHLHYHAGILFLGGTEAFIKVLLIRFPSQVLQACSQQWGFPGKVKGGLGYLA
jgi:hypothetical protein